jgi:hypothetical protein
MANNNAFRAICKSLVIAAALALAGLMYLLHLVGVSTVGFLFGFSAALLVFAVIMFGAVVTHLE